MIFQAPYKTLEKPLLLMKSVLSDKDYGTEKHLVTIEVPSDEKQEVLFSFYDKKSKTEIVYTMTDAEVLLEGIATCSLKVLYDTLKSFKKSDDVIMIEREADELRVDDGVFPEEMILLMDDEELVVIEDIEESFPLFSVDGSLLSSSLSRSTVILRKTDIPTEKVDTQAVYLTGMPDVPLSINSFSIHHAYTESIHGTTRYPFALAIPKPTASLLNRLLALLPEIECSSSTVEDSESLLIQDVDKHVRIMIKGSFMVNTSISTTFTSVKENLDERLASEEVRLIENIKLPKKVTAQTNVQLSGDELVESVNGYSGKMLNDLIKKGGFDKNCHWLDIQDEGVLLVRAKDDSSEKTLSVSYRTAESA